MTSPQYDNSFSTLQYMSRKLLLFIFVLFIVLVLVHCFTNMRQETHKFTENPSEHLRKDGIALYKNGITEDEIDVLKFHSSNKNYNDMKTLLLNNDRLRELVADATGSTEYVFQDYIWIIEKSSVHTCHRDNNGDFFNSGQKHPSYTMIVYLENMGKCLLVIPKSHECIYSNYINFNNPTKNVLCKRGDVIIFNANLIHAGTLTEKENNKRVQLKITHQEDIPHIKYYENYNKVLDKENKHPIYVRKIQQGLSCAFPGLSNLTQSENIRTARGSQDGEVEIGYPQKMFSYIFYGNPDYYDLPNAF